MVTNSAGGNDGERWEVSWAAGPRPVVDAGWAVEVSSGGRLEPDEVLGAEENEEEIKEEEEFWE